MRINHLIGLLVLALISSLSYAQNTSSGAVFTKIATRNYGGMDLEADIFMEDPIIYHGISNAGCAQAVTLADNRSLTVVWQRQVDDGYGCGACVEEWKLIPGNDTVINTKMLFRTVDGQSLLHDFNAKPSKFKEGLRVYPSCIGAKGWGVRHVATAEQ